MLFQNLILISVGIAFSKTTEKQVTSSTIEVKDLGKYLVDLDGKILRMLILPEKGKGDELLEYLESYWKNFHKLDGLVVLSEQSGFRPAKYMLEQECPKFVQEGFDVTNLQQTYEWDTAKFSKFRDLVILIAGLAAKFQDDFSKMRVDVETLFENPRPQEP